MSKMLRSKIVGVYAVVKARGFVLVTERMTMAAVEALPDRVMCTAQLEAQAQMVRGTLDKKAKDYADDLAKKIRIELVREDIK